MLFNFISVGLLLEGTARYAVGYATRKRKWLDGKNQKQVPSYPKC
jgi:hypothetical protein